MKSRAYRIVDILQILHNRPLEFAEKPLRIVERLLRIVERPFNMTFKTLGFGHNLSEDAKA